MIVFSVSAVGLVSLAIIFVVVETAVKLVDAEREKAKAELAAANATAQRLEDELAEVRFRSSWPTQCLEGPLWAAKLEIEHVLFLLAAQVMRVNHEP